jgi:hypothetical protein
MPLWACPPLLELPAAFDYSETGVANLDEALPQAASGVARHALINLWPLSRAPESSGIVPAIVLDITGVFASLRQRDRVRFRPGMYAAGRAFRTQGTKKCCTHLE